MAQFQPTFWTPCTLECTLRSANNFLLKLPENSMGNYAFVVRASKVEQSA